MAFDGTLKFDTAIDKTGFKLGLNSLGSLAKTGMAAVTAAVTAATGAVAALGGYAVGVGKNFESSMAQVIATMGITKDTIQDGVNSYDLLKKAAAKAGESTVFSASEAADALNCLALAGYSAAQAADALPAVLDLASAGGMELAYASDLATDAMAALGITADQTNLTHFGDQLAKTASKANASVSQLGEAILTVGGTAKSLAGGTTELNTALGILANVGIKGSEGGTALRNIILALSAPTEKAAAELASLGVRAYDAQGDLRPLNEIFKDLDRALSGMTEGEKTQVLNSIFNKVDLKSAQALLANCGAEFDSLFAAVEDCGGAMAQMSATMNDTLEGDLKSLNSKLEAFGNNIYDSLNAPLRELVQLGGDYISQLNAALSDGDFSGLASSLGAVAADAVATLSGYVPTLVEMGVELTQSLIRGLTDNAPQILESLMSAAESLILGIFAVSGDLVELGKTLVLSLISGLVRCLPDVLTAALDLMTALIDGLLAMLPELAPAAVKIVTTLAQTLAERLPELIPMLFELFYGIIGVLTDPALITALISAAGTIIKALLEGLIAAAPQVWGYIPQIVTNIFAALSEAIPLLSQLGIELIAQLADGMKENAPAMLAAFGEIGAALLDGIGEYFSSILAYAGELLSDLLSGVSTGLSSIRSKVTGWFADSISAAKKSASDIVSGAMEFLDELPGKIGKMLGNALGKIVSWAVEAPELAQNAASDFVSNAIEFLSQLPSKSKKLLDDTVSRVKNFGAELVTRGKKAADDLVSRIVETVTTLPQKMRETGKNLVEGLWNGITGAGSWLRSRVADFGSGIISGFKESFGIHSPSTVMRDSVGKYLAQGIGVGFVGEMADVGRNIVESVENIIPEIDVPDSNVPKIRIRPSEPEPSFPRFDRAAIYSGIVQQSPTAAVTNNYTSYSTVNSSGQEQNITIHATFAMDSDIVAEGVADIALSKLDEQQGITITMKKRGAAR